MPTASDTAAEEARRWMELAGRWAESAAPAARADRPPTEKDVVVFFDPHADLAKRAASWSHQLEAVDLSAVAGLAAGLADAESRAWESLTPDVATRAYEDRRFLLSDRLIHWAVPWLDMVGRRFDNLSEAAHTDRDFLLELGEVMRPAPAVGPTEGLMLEGHDSYGPTQPHRDLDLWLSSLWSGELIPRDQPRRNLESVFVSSEARWEEMANAYPGSAQLWSDLARRAQRTADILKS